MYLVSCGTPAPQAHIVQTETLSTNAVADRVCVSNPCPKNKCFTHQCHQLCKGVGEAKGTSQPPPRKRVQIVHHMIPCSRDTWFSWHHNVHPLTYCFNFLIRCVNHAAGAGDSLSLC